MESGKIDELGHDAVLESEEFSAGREKARYIEVPAAAGGETTCAGEKAVGIGGTH